MVAGGVVINNINNNNNMKIFINLKIQMYYYDYLICIQYKKNCKKLSMMCRIYTFNCNKKKKGKT